ncbi:hypothetical protein [Mycetocola sp.]|uniref:hypothetical protein n=1 Tax=Mycetocola sp. TaxID=1871042 RepID=UPI003989501A
MSYLNATTPEELRTAVEQNRNQFSDLIADLEVDALTEAKASVGDRAMPWLLRLNDSFIERAMAEATLATGFKTPPDPGKAIIVLSNGFAISEMGDPEFYGFRWWKYVSDLTGPTWVTPGALLPCHRCDPAGWIKGPYEARPIEAVFHVARGRCVVEFAFCADCVTHYLALSASAR